MSTEEVPYGTIQGNKIILNPWKNYPKREIGEVREEGESVAIEYFINRFQELESKVAELEKTIEETENKGSYLQKVLHIKGGLPEHDALGDYASLDDRLEKQETTLQEIIAKNRIRNTEIKHTLTEELREAVKIIDWQESTEAIQDIKSRWIKVGNAVQEEQKTLDDTFWGEVQNYFDRKRAFYEDKRRLEKKHEQDYWDLIKESQGLFRYQGKERFTKVKALQEAWREVGNIPSMKYKPLLAKFQYNLKGGNARSNNPSKELDNIQEELLAFQQGSKVFTKERGDELKKALFDIKSRDPKTDQRKRDCLDLLQLLSEIAFVQSLCIKKYKGFNELPILDQNGKQVEVLQELIRRDEEDLEKYETNSENFSTKDDQVQHMMNRKLAQQRNKIKIKQRLIAILGG